MAKKSKPQQQRSLSLVEKKERRLDVYMWLIPIFALLIKIITMLNIPEGAWFGADGENYIAGVNALLADGFSSKEPKLQYWPAGYPLLLWPLAKISLVYFYPLVTILQSLFYAFSSYRFAKAIRKSPFKNFAFITALLISFNPTLSLSSMTIGYEAPIAAIFMMVVSLMFENGVFNKSKRFIVSSVAIGILLMLASAMQPRYMFVGIVLVALWAFKLNPRKSAALTVVAVLAIISIAPVVLIARNNAATGSRVISTNLGVTMRIGAGEGTSGGYMHTGPEVPCVATPPATSPSDNEIVKCVIKWYFTHPVKAVKLAVTKSFWFWSPWVGPETNGTMARNPWLKINPVMNIMKTQSGKDLVFGWFGKFISWLWIFLQMATVVAGFYWLYISTQRRLAILLAVPVFLSWLISLATIGDHRFRIPTMGLSLALQVAGWYGMARKFKPLQNL